MLEFLLETVAKKKEEILKKLEEIEKRKEAIKPPWKDYEIREVSGKKIAAEDGSYEVIEFRTFSFYAVASQLFFYGEKLESLRACDIDILWPVTRSEDRLRFYMHIFESKICLEGIRKFNPDLILLDGSLLGMLIRPFPEIFNLSAEIKEEINKKFIKSLEENLESSVEIYTKKLWPYIQENFPDFKIETTHYLEYVEHLLSLYRLLKVAKDKIVAIAKTSRANKYFNLGIPDMAVFEKYSKREGYSSPKHYSLELSNIKWRFPILDEEFKKLNFTIFYTRLQERKNVLKFEVPYKIEEDRMIEILENIKYISTDGYPYLLKKAHREAIIRRKDIEHLVKLFGLVERTGREML